MKTTTRLEELIYNNVTVIGGRDELLVEVRRIEADNAALREALEMIADENYTWMPQIKEIARAALLAQDSAQQSVQLDGAFWACDECNHYPNLSNACENCGTPRR